MPKRKKSKSKKTRKLREKKFKLPFKLSEDQEFNLIFLELLRWNNTLFFGVLGTIINFILGAWKWWAVLISFIVFLFFGKKL